MANPFVAGAGGDPTDNLPTPDTFDQLKEQWNTFLDKPEGRAALLSFGINLMQPPHFGDNPLAQIGRAIGAAGETGGNIEKMDIAQEEAASKEALRAQTAETGAMRGAAIGANQQLQLERLANQKAAEEHRVSSSKLQAQINLQKMYNGVRSDIEAANEKRAADPLNVPGSPNYRAPSPVPTLSEYIVSDPLARATAIEAGMNVPVGATPAPSPAPAAIPEAPPNPTDRKPGTKYNTPKGPLTWTGTGWI